MKKRLWILVSCIVLILCTAFGTMAAYTSRSFVKGVATTPKQGLGLSSDYLVVAAKSAPNSVLAVRKILLEEKGEEDDSPYTFTFYVQNSSDGSVNKLSILYTLSVTGLPDGAIVQRDGEDITQAAKSSTGAEAPLMPAYTKRTHYYTIRIPKEVIEEASELTVKAIPDEESDSSGNMIAAVFQPSVAGVIAGFSYRGVFVDETTQNKPSDYAAFNYEILVFNATESYRMVLTWDTQYVEIDPLFLSEIGDPSVDENDTIYSVEFPMDAVHDHYLVQFYRLVGQDETADWQSSWEKMKKIIMFEKKTDSRFVA